MTTSEKLRALVEQRAEQDQRMAEAGERLARLGAAVVTVPLASLAAIANACVASFGTVGNDAIRG